MSSVSSSFLSAASISSFDTNSTTPSPGRPLCASAYVTSPIFRKKSFRSCQLTRLERFSTFKRKFVLVTVPRPRDPKRSSRPLPGAPRLLRANSTLMRLPHSSRPSWSRSASSASLGSSNSTKAKLFFTLTSLSLPNLWNARSRSFSRTCEFAPPMYNRVVLNIIDNCPLSAYICIDIR